MSLMTSGDILVVDDEADIRDLVAGILEDEGYSVRTAADSDAAMAALRARRPSLLIQDIWMQGGGLDGLEVLDVVKGLDPDLPVIMISGHGNIETAVVSLDQARRLRLPWKSPSSPTGCCWWSSARWSRRRCSSARTERLRTR